MCGCWSRAASRISRSNRSAENDAPWSEARTLMTTSRPKRVSSATKTRDIPPPPSSRSMRYVSPRAAWRLSRRSDVIRRESCSAGREHQNCRLAPPTASRALRGRGDYSARRILRDRQQIPVGIPEPGDARATRRQPHTAGVLLQPPVPLQRDPLLLERGRDDIHVAHLPSEGGEARRCERANLLQAELHAVRVEHEREVVLVAHGEAKCTDVEARRARRVRGRAERNELRVAQHLGV